MFTRTFWLLTGERAVKTFAGVLAAALVASNTGLLDASWQAATALAVLSAFVSVLTSLASLSVSTGKAADREVRITTAEEIVRSGSAEGGVPDVPIGSKVREDDIAAVRYRLARERVELELEHLLPANPRTAKRMVNHLSLALAIAEQRGLFLPGSGITVAHLAKWVSILEEWPSLGAVLSNHPERMGELESARDATHLQGVLCRWAPTLDVSDELHSRIVGGAALAPSSHIWSGSSHIPPGSAEDHTRTRPSTNPEKESMRGSCRSEQGCGRVGL